MPFNSPGTIELIKRKRRCRYARAHRSYRDFPDADQSTPGSHADDFSKLRLLEQSWEHIASRTGHAIASMHFGP